MDLTLALTYQQQNDNKAIVLTDTTTDWNSTTTNLTATDVTVAGSMYEVVTSATLDLQTIGATDVNPIAGTRFVADAIGTLGAGDELSPVTPTYAEVTTMTLDTTVTGVDETATPKDQVDLLTEFGPFAVAADTVYTITAALLGDAADSLLVDGLYALTYIVGYTGAGGAVEGTDTLNVTILVYGQVKVATYEKLREISVYYMCTNGCPSPEISEADLCGAYLSGIENSAFTAKTEELLTQLIVLDGIITNGSKITW